MKKKSFSIGEVVRHLLPDCEVSESSLRFWERMGLLCSRRTPGGHRVYTEEDLKRIRIIKRLQTRLYMPLSQILKLCQSSQSTQELAVLAEFQEHFNRPLGYDPSFQPLSLTDVSERTGLAPDTLHALQDAGAIRSVSTEGEARYDEDGLRVAEIFTELARFGIEPDSLRETCELTSRLVEAQYQYFLDKVSPALPDPQSTDTLKLLNDLGQELTRIIYHQTYVSVGARLSRDGKFHQAEAESIQKAKHP